MATAGSVIVDFLARTGTFETDVARATKSVQRFSKGVKDSFLGNLGAGFARDFIQGIASIPGRMVDLVKSTIDAADHLGDLSKSTGVAVETLGGIGFAASQAGSSLEGVASGIGKLNQTLAKAASGNKEAIASLKALGVQAIDPLTGKTIEADKALIQLAETFEKTGDSPEKFHAAAKALGKQYQELVPLLQGGGKALRENIEYYKRYGGVSTETTKKAGEFNDTLDKLNLLSGAFGRNLTAELLTPLQNLANLFLQAKENGDQFRGVASDVANGLKAIATFGAFVALTFTALGDQIGALIAKAAALGRLDFKGFSAIGKDADENLKAARARFDALYDAINGPATGSSGPSKPKGRIPGLGDAGSAAEAEALLKRSLDGQLKLIKDFGEQQKDALSFANKLLEGEYQDHIISLANFFGDQQNIRSRALQVQLDEQDKIIAAEKKFAASTANPTSRIDAENKIAEAVRTKERLIIKAGQEEQIALQQNARDVLALQHAFEGLNAQVLDLQENFAAAAAIKFDIQNDALKKTFTAEGNEAGLKALDTLRAAAIAQAAFQKASLESGRTFEALQRQEDLLAIAQQAGALTTIEALIKVGDARKAQIEILEAQVAAEEAIAKASGMDTLIANAQRARIALEQLKATADPLADQFKGIFEGAFSNAFADFITGSATAAQAFKAFSKSVIADLARIASQQLAQKLFSGAGSGGGFDWTSLLNLVGSFGANTTDYRGTTLPNDLRGGGMGASGAPMGKSESPVPSSKQNLTTGAMPPVQIVNNTGTAATAKAQRMDDGTLQVVMEAMEDRIVGNIAKGGNVHRAMADTYGLNRGRGLPKRG